MFIKYVIVAVLFGAVKYALTDMCGIMLGALDVVIILWCCWFVVNKAYYYRDKYTIINNAKKYGISPVDEIKKYALGGIVDFCEKNRGNDKVIKEYLKERAKRETITKACADILFDEYKSK